MIAEPSVGAFGTGLSTPPRARVAGATLALWEGRHTRAVSLVAALLAVAATTWSFASQTLVAYNDAASHLVIARRILDSLTPGLGQIGTTWLPLPHLLLQPFVYLDPLYQTGLAASIVGLGCFVITCVCTYRFCFLLTRQETAALVGASLVGLNPNLLYVQGTALTEPVLLACFAAATYYLARWSLGLSTQDLTLAGLATFGGVLSRYDGWVLIPAGFLVITLVALRTRGDELFAEGSALAFTALGTYAAFLWVFYQWLIFGDPLYFIRNPFSAQSQQAALAEAGKLLTKGNMALSLAQMSWAVAYNLGFVVSVAGLLGLVLFAVARRRSASVFTPLSLVAPFAFNVLALYMGQTVISTPHDAPAPLFNVRYGLTGLLLAAFGVAWLARQIPRSWPVLAAAIVLQSVWLAGVDRTVLLQDALVGLSGPYGTQASAWLRSHYDDGLILIDPYPSAPLIFRTGLPLRTFIQDGNQPYWEQALADPTISRWVVMVFQDRLDTAFEGGRRLQPTFERVYYDQQVAIWRRLRPLPETGAPSPEQPASLPGEGGKP